MNLSNIILSNFFPVIVIIIIMFFLVIWLTVQKIKNRMKSIKEFSLYFNYDYYSDGSFLTYLDKDLGYQNVEIDDNYSFWRLLNLGGVDLSYTGIPLFDEGDSRKALNVVGVTYKGSKVYFFDYSYVVGSGKHSTKYEFGIALYKLNKGCCPTFYLRPENFLDKVGEFVGLDDIDINGFENFSKKYYLKGENRDLIINFFTPNKVRFFEENPGWSLYSSGLYIAILKGKGFVKIEDYQIFVDDVLKILSVMEL